MSFAMRRRLLLAGGVFVLAVLAFIGTQLLRGATVGDRFDFVRWEVASLPNKWLYRLGSPMRDDPSPDDALVRYFALDDRDGSEARRLENEVERMIEGRIDAVLGELGLEWPGSVVAVWPPVDVELAGSPRVLVISPRDHIERVDTSTLRPDIVRAEAEAIEQRTEKAHPDESALVVGTGGLSTYPAVVSNRESYADTVSTAAHEWTHHYLSIFPLGRDYFGSGDTPTINETVADFVGDEVGRIVLDRWGEPGKGPETPTPVPTATPSPTPTSTPTPSATAAPAPTSTPLDFNQTMRDLRTEVDSLLAAGQIDRAEARMEEVRLQLNAAGYQIRRINQAYFAWYGTYAARGDSVDPLGSDLRNLREEAGSLREFLLLVRGATTRDDVARLLASEGG